MNCQIWGFYCAFLGIGDYFGRLQSVDFMECGQGLNFAFECCNIVETITSLYPFFLLGQIKIKLHFPVIVVDGVVGIGFAITIQCESASDGLL